MTVVVINNLILNCTKHNFFYYSEEQQGVVKVLEYSGVLFGMYTSESTVVPRSSSGIYILCKRNAKCLTVIRQKSDENPPFISPAHVDHRRLSRSIYQEETSANRHLLELLQKLLGAGSFCFPGSLCQEHAFSHISDDVSHKHRNPVPIGTAVPIHTSNLRFKLRNQYVNARDSDLS